MECKWFLQMIFSLVFEAYLFRNSEDFLFTDFLLLELILSFFLAWFFKDTLLVRTILVLMSDFSLALSSFAIFFKLQNAAQEMLFELIVFCLFFFLFFFFSGQFDKISLNICINILLPWDNYRAFGLTSYFYSKLRSAMAVNLVKKSGWSNLLLERSALLLFLLTLLMYLFIFLKPFLNVE